MGIGISRGLYGAIVNGAIAGAAGAAAGGGGASGAAEGAGAAEGDGTAGFAAGRDLRRSGTIPLRLNS